MNTQEMKQQAQYIWNRLDDLATTDPNAYKKFIEEQMKERELYNSAPEPRMCVYVETEKGCGLFVNICAWKRIPYPRDESEPLKLICGFKHQENSAESRSRAIVPVAANDQVIDEIQKSSFDKVDFIKLVMKFVEKEQKIKLKDKFEICKDLYKGILPADSRRLFIRNPGIDFNEESLRDLLSNKTNIGDTLSSPESLLKNIASESHPQESNSEVDYVEAALHANNNKTKNLIQEVDKPIQEPKFTLNETQQGNLILKINLPGVESSTDCDLTISQTQVELEVSGKFSLKLSLPAPVDEDLAKAKFIKKSSVLTLTIPVLKGQSTP